MSESKLTEQELLELPEKPIFTNIKIGDKTYDRCDLESSSTHMICFNNYDLLHMNILEELEDIHKSGIYIQARREDDELPIYIGETNNIANRIKKHKTEETSNRKKLSDENCIGMLFFYSDGTIFQSSDNRKNIENKLAIILSNVGYHVKADTGNFKPINTKGVYNTLEDIISILKYCANEVNISIPKHFKLESIFELTTKKVLDSMEDGHTYHCEINGWTFTFRYENNKSILLAGNKVKDLSQNATKKKNIGGKRFELEESGDIQNNEVMNDIVFSTPYVLASQVTGTSVNLSTKVLVDVETGKRVRVPGPVVEKERKLYDNSAS